MNKTCTKCNKTKPLLDFKPDPRYKLGVTSWCKACYITHNKNKGYTERWIKNNPLRSKEIKAKYVLLHPEQVKQSKKTWDKLNAKHKLALVRNYQMKKKNATPKWLTPLQYRQIQKVYESCRPDFHVDHIVPIQGKNVCGLHVPWNLQILNASENLKKSNKII
jgi:hypothetical protein